MEPKNIKFTRVVIETPYRNANPKIQEYNKQFAFACMDDALRNHYEAGFASHTQYTEFLNEENEYERTLGIWAGFAWREVAEKSVVYTNLGTSTGVQWGIEDSIKKGKPVEYRTLSPEQFKAFHDKHKHLLEEEPVIKEEMRAVVEAIALIRTIRKM